MFDCIHVCEEGYLETYLNTLEAIKNNSIDITKIESISLLFKNNNNENEYSLFIEGDIAHIYVNGFLSNDGPDLIQMIYGIKGTGYNNIIKAFNIANSDDCPAKEIYLHITSPGGNVGIIDKVWDVIWNSNKKVTAFCSGQCCSGGYWLASAADKIISEDAVTMFGSIGVVISGYDSSDFLKKMGIKFVKIRSSNAPNKQAGIDTDEGIKSLQSSIDAVEGIFISRVASGRGITPEDVIKNYGKGGVVVALDLRNNDSEKKYLDALSIGMIDIVLGSENENYKTQKDEVNMSGQSKDSKVAHQPVGSSESPAVNTEQNETVKNGDGPLSTIIQPASVSNNMAGVFAIMRSPVYSANDEIRNAGLNCLAGAISQDKFFAKVAQFDASYSKVKDEDSKKLGQKIAGIEVNPEDNNHEPGSVFDQASFDQAVNELV